MAQAVDDVAAKGVSHFSSAGNRAATESYDSPLRIVPANPSTLQNSNLDFSAVDPALYAGGFHDFLAGPGRDIAQTVAFDPGSLIVLQWNEPFDPIPPTVIQVIASETGTVPDGGDTTFTFDGTAGQIVEIFLDGNPAGPGEPNPDLTFALFDPNGGFIQFVDTTTNPESLILQLPLDGTYTVHVDSFQPAQVGDFLFRVSEVEVTEQVLSDYNLLFFFEDGSFAGAFAEQNLFSNRPAEAGFLPGLTLQVVIARPNVPAARNRNVADRIRYVGFDGVFPQEHFSYLGPVTYGHNSARGAMGVAAYAFFSPFVPEGFSSPGPSTIYFNKDNKRLKKPDIRQKPDMAAMDGANTTFFFEDALEDPDDFPNFFGTSAAAPHAAAIAALVLEAAGGTGQGQAEPDAPDPSAERLPARPRPVLLLGLRGDRREPADNQRVGRFQRRQHVRSEFLHVVADGAETREELLHQWQRWKSHHTPKGLVFDERPDVGQPFAIGRSIGIDASDVTNVFTRLAIPPGVAGRWKQLNLRFRSGAFGNGDLLSFGVDRDEADAEGEAVSAVAGGSADLLGGGVLIPSGPLVPNGARFFGSYESGARFEGRFRNAIGRGYSQLDGYGFINAEAAVNAVRKE